MLKKLIDYEFENLIQQLNQAKCIYDTPVEYLQGILKRKYEYPTYSDEDWELVEKEENELASIGDLIDSAIETACRLKNNTHKIYMKKFNK